MLQLKSRAFLLENDTVRRKPEQVHILSVGFLGRGVPLSWQNQDPLHRLVGGFLANAQVSFQLLNLHDLAAVVLILVLGGAEKPSEKRSSPVRPWGFLFCRSCCFRWTPQDSHRLTLDP